MKKILLLSVFVFLVSCDDGEITLASFDFNTEEAVEKCNSTDIFYKTTSNELLLINIAFTYFQNEVTSTPIQVAVDNSTTTVLYRTYDATISGSNICSTIPLATPVVTKEWVATGGTIEIETNEVLTNGTVTGYTHTITFKNINFASSSESFSFESYLFGSYVTSL